MTENLVFRTYSRHDRRVDEQEIIDMLRGKPVRVEYEVKLDPDSFSQHLQFHDGIILGLPSERHHTALSVSLRGLGYTRFERKAADPVTQPVDGAPTREERADAAY